MQVKNLCQAGNHDILGDGPKTISQAGCMLTCYAMAANALNAMRLTPTTANDILRQANAFIGSSAVMDKVCRRFDMRYKRAKAEIADIFDAIEDGKTVVMLGVDYKPGTSSGFSDADHFILAYALGETVDKKRCLVVADPATGHDITVLEEDVVGGKQLVAHPSPRVTWRVCEATFLTSNEKKP